MSELLLPLEQGPCSLDLYQGHGKKYHQSALPYIPQAVIFPLLSICPPILVTGMLVVIAFTGKKHLWLIHTE